MPHELPEDLLKWVMPRPIAMPATGIKSSLISASVFIIHPPLSRFPISYTDITVIGLQKLWLHHSDGEEQICIKPLIAGGDDQTDFRLCRCLVKCESLDLLQLRGSAGTA